MPDDQPSRLATAFAAAIAAGDFAAVGAFYAEDARMTAYLPARTDEFDGRDAIAGAFGRWFGDGPVDVLETEARTIVDRTRLSFLAISHEPPGDLLVEQHQYVELEDGHITRSRLVCSGFRPIDPVPASPDEVFDAGALGCGTGLAGAFRERVQVVPVGSTLHVIARDPAAWEELPALARLLGHAVERSERNPDGTVSVHVTRLH